MATKDHRSAVTGRYVKEGYAIRYPHLTVSEARKPKGKGKGKGKKG